MIATEDEAFHCEWDYIKNKYPKYVEIILKAIKNEENHITVNTSDRSLGKDGDFLEIQWD